MRTWYVGLPLASRDPAGPRCEPFLQSAVSATPESTCICEISAGFDALKVLSADLVAKTTATQMELRSLGPVAPVHWETWATAEIKTGTLKGACWKDAKWQASVKKVVLLIERTFNEAAESVDDVFFVADYLETISWLGGVRVYEEASRLSRDALESISLEGPVRRSLFLRRLRTDD